MTEYLTPDGDPYGGAALPGPPPRRRRGVLVGTASAFLVLVAGTGIYVATQLAGGGLQPEGLAPRSTFAFVRVDLDPSAGQKIAVKQFAAHFPSAPKAEAEGIFGELVSEALQGDDELNYERDVEPWLGKRVGIAGFADSAGEPQAVGILQSKDDGAARAALDRIAAGEQEFAYRLTRGYAVVGVSQVVVDAAVAAAEKSSLADYDTFDADVARLKGDQILVAWTDLTAALRAAGTAADAGILPSALGAQIGGTFVLGGHVASDYVEMEGYVIGSTLTRELNNRKPELLENLPASTVAALSVNDLGKTVEKQLDQLAASGIQSVIDDFESETGLDLRKDLLPLFGEQTVAAFGALPFFLFGGEPKMAVVSKVVDAAKARLAGQKLETLSGLGDVPIESDVRGNTFYLTAGRGYLGELVRDGNLGESTAFKKAMGDLGDDVNAAVFVNLAAMTDTYPDDFDDGNTEALLSFGAWGGVRDDAQYVRVRLAVR